MTLAQRCARFAPPCLLRVLPPEKMSVGPWPSPFATLRAGSLIEGNLVHRLGIYHGTEETP